MTSRPIPFPVRIGGPAAAAVLHLLLLGGPLPAANTDSSGWPQFRGSDQAHAAAGQRPPLRWDESRNVAWKTPLPADGWSSPVVGNGRVWMTGAAADGRRLLVLAVDAATGAVTRQVPVLTPDAALPKHAANSHASPTPVLVGHRVIASFGAAGIAAVDARSGEVLWSHQDLRIDHDSNGAGSSPVTDGERVYLNCDGTDARYVAALDPDTGRILWRSPRSNPIDKAAYFKKAHSTPVFRSVAGTRELVTVGSFRVSGLDPDTGAERWGLELPGFCAVPAPVVDPEGGVYVCTGFEKSQLWAIDIPPSGTPEVRWRQRRQVPLVSTPVLERGLLFHVSDGGIASCVDPATGRVAWSERIGGSHWASPLAVNGFVHFFDAEGTTTVVAADREFRVVSVNTLDEGVKASPAVDGSALLLRTTGHLYRLGD